MTMERRLGRKPLEETPKKKISQENRNSGQIHKGGNLGLAEVRDGRCQKFQVKREKKLIKKVSRHNRGVGGKVKVGTRKEGLGADVKKTRSQGEWEM